MQGAFSTGEFGEQLGSVQVLHKLTDEIYVMQVSINLPHINEEQEQPAAESTEDKKESK